MIEQPTFEPKDIGEGPEGAPPVLRPREVIPEVPPPSNANVLPDAWENGTVAAVNEAQQGVLPGDEIEIKPAGTVESPELKPGDIGYSDKTGNNPTLE